jgi:subtilisin family serine protease
VLAPGVRILSAFPDSTYARVDGTSMAGPHVVGVVALMWSANPSLIGDIERSEAILAETARPYMGAVADLDAFANNEETQPVDLGSTCVIQTDLDIRPNDIAGFGLVDAYAAVERALAAPGA